MDFYMITLLDLIDHDRRDRADERSAKGSLEELL